MCKKPNCNCLKYDCGIASSGKRCGCEMNNSARVGSRDGEYICSDGCIVSKSDTENLLWQYFENARVDDGSSSYDIVLGSPAPPNSASSERFRKLLESEPDVFTLFMSEKWVDENFCMEEVRRWQKELGELYWRPDGELVRQGMVPPIIRNNYRVLTDILAKENRREKNKTIDLTVASFFRETLTEEEQLLVDHLLDLDSLENCKKDTLFGMIEFLLILGLKTDDELFQLKVQRELIEKNLHVLFDFMCSASDSL